MANYKYSYNEDDIRPAEPVGEYKVKTALPNQTLVTAILSYVFFGWFGIIIAIYALQKVRNFYIENDGAESKMIKAAKILAITNLVLTGIGYTASIAMGIFWYIIIPLMYAPGAEEVVSSVFNTFLNLI